MDGVLRIKGMPQAQLALAQVAGAMFARSDLLPEGVDPNPEATYVWTAPGRTPADDQGRAKSYLTAANACHVVLVEVDVETGKTEILKYWIADDCGTRLNPATVEGMTQGGVAQGVGAALLEEYVYDENGAAADVDLRRLPACRRIYEVPMTEKRALVTPSPFTPLGAKGVGEAAMHTTPAAVMCAINDALAPLGVQAHEVPASPNRIWKLVKPARESAPSTEVDRGRKRSLRRSQRMSLHEPGIDARDELLPGLRALVEEHRRRHARLGRRPRSRRRRGDARAARARSHQVHGHVRRRRLLRAARVDDGRRRLLDVHVDQRLHHEGDRALQGPHVPRVQLRPDSAPRRRATRSGSSSTWSRTRNAKLCKVYAPEDGPLNDKRLWPFYEKACELDIALTIHTGMSYVCPQPSKFTHPSLLDDVCLDFPDLKIIAYHMAWPHHEELMGLAGKHRNLYLSLSGIIGWLAHAPYRGYHMIGEALQWVSDDKIVMGLDLAFDDMGKAVDYIRNLQMPEELQEKWGYKPITDETRAKILGLNLAKLAKIDTKRRPKGKREVSSPRRES